MNDDELDRLVAQTAPLAEGQVASLDLRDAEIELMEEIMATTTTEVRLAPGLRPPRPRFTGLRIAAAAAAVVAVAVAGVAINGQEDGGSVESGNVTSPGTTTELPRLIPDAGDLPDGLQLSSAYGDQELWGESTTYGRLLAVEWTHSGRGSGIEPSPDLGPTTVRGHQGHTCAGAVCAQLGLKGVEAGLEWTERPGMQIYLASPSLTAEQLAGIAEGLVVHGNGVSVGTLPAGVPELGERSRTAVIPDEEGDGRGQVMRRTDVEVVYRLGDPSGALRVQTADGDAAALADELGDEATPSADVRGHAAWAATLPPGSVHPSDSGTWNVERRRIFWQEGPGVVATVETWDTDYDLDVLRDVAEGLRPATDGEWAEMLVATDVAAGFLPQP